MNDGITFIALMSMFCVALLEVLQCSECAAAGVLIFSPLSSLGNVYIVM